MTTGITGATGQLGQLVVEKLKAIETSGNLVALVRSPEKAAGLGIPARAFDYSAPENLAGALAGIDTLLLISSSEFGRRAKQHESVINAAKEAGIKRIVYTSLLHTDTSTLSLAPEHLATEEMLKASGIPHTILRNGWYTENYFGSISGAVQAGVLVGSAGEGKISSATRADFAEAAAVVLTSEGHDGKVYELAGDGAYTLAELAAQISARTGKEIAYQNLPETEYAEVLIGLGVPEAFAHMIAGWDTSIAKGEIYDDSKELSKLIGRPTTPLAESLKTLLA